MMISGITTRPSAADASSQEGAQNEEPRVSYGFSFGQGKQVWAEVYLDMGERDLSKAAFDALASDAVAIEGEFGEPLRWERLDHRDASRVAVYRPGSIDDEPETLEEIRAWAVDRLLRLKKVFGDRIMRLER